MLVYWENYMTNLLQYLKECQDRIGEIIIDQGFIDFRNEHKEKFRAGGRDDRQRLMDADCLITEYALINNGFVNKPENKRHDFIKDNDKVDAKIISSLYFNVPEDKVTWYMENIRSGNLTHFAFYKFVVRPGAPLKPGDKVLIRLDEVRDAEYVMNKLRPSNKDGYYYIVQNNVVH
jgi:hypothetical protein